MGSIDSGIGNHGVGIANTFIVDEILESERGYARGPERALLSALLFDGIQSYMSYACAHSSACKERYREAYSWVHSPGTEYVFSFESVCDALGIEPEYLRLGLANACNSQTFEWKRQRRKF